MVMSAVALVPTDSRVGVLADRRGMPIPLGPGPQQPRSLLGDGNLSWDEVIHQKHWGGAVDNWGAE